MTVPVVHFLTGPNSGTTPLTPAPKVRLASVAARTDGALGIDWRVAKLLQSVDQHNGAAGWEDICQKASLSISPAYAARLFQRHTGQGVRKYATDKRLLRAAEQLITTDLPIKTIAGDLGYRKPFDFARTFRKQYGFAPRRFRAICLRLAFTQTVQLEKAREGIDMVVRSDAQGRSSNTVPAV